MKAHIPSPLQRLERHRLIYVKRDDLIHPHVSGNKFRKLKYNLEKFIQSHKKEILSFGGAFSNHIHAISFACYQKEIPLTLLIRGEEVENETLNDCLNWGAKLRFLDRSLYRNRNDPTFLKALEEDHPGSFIVPEGGTNKWAFSGIKEMMLEIYEKVDFDQIQFCVSYGSGGTALGMLKCLRKKDQLYIFPSIKVSDFDSELNNKAETFDIKTVQAKVITPYHFGGYAKWDDKLIDFINDFNTKYGFSLDPIYTGKLFYGVMDSLKEGTIDPEIPIIIIHSGGLQGIRGFNQRFGNLIH